MKLNKKAKLAIIGCGAVTQNFYIPALKSLNICPVIFVDKNIDSARKCSKKFRGSQALSSIENNYERFNEAIITLPNTLHYSFAKELLNKGKNLLIEKPLTINSLESAELMTIANNKNLVVICGNMRRQLRSAKFIKKIISNKTLGNVISFKCREGGIFNWPIQSESFWKKDFSGGGVLLDTGSHTLEQIFYHLGIPDSIQYYDNAIDNIESDCFIKFKYKNFKGSLQLSRTLGLDCKFYIQFEKGDVIFDLVGNKLDFNCNRETLNKLGLENFKQNNQSYDDLISIQISEWYKKINGLDSNVVDVGEAHEVMKAIDFCYKNKNLMEF